MRYVALIVLALALSACASTTTTQATARTQATASAPPSSAPTPSASPSPLLTCSTLIPGDTNSAGTPLTAVDVIANLDAVFGTQLVAIEQGNLSDTSYSVLFEAGSSFSGYSGNKLSADAAQFSQDENEYLPDANQTEIDTSYVGAMLKDDIKLTADCPASYKLSKELEG